MKTESPDGNSTAGNDEVDSGSANKESSYFSQAADAVLSSESCETRQHHEVDAGTVNSYVVSVSEDGRHGGFISSEKPITSLNGGAEILPSRRNEAEQHKGSPLETCLGTGQAGP